MINIRYSLLGVAAIIGAFFISTSAAIPSQDIATSNKSIFIRAHRSCLRPGSVCEPGTTCVGTKKKKRCKKPMTEGKPCKGDPFWVCAKGLRCVGRICRRPTVPELGSCLRPGSVCERGTRCVGSKSKKMCKRPIEQGKYCRDDPFWICAKGLRCIRNKCQRRHVREFESCLRPGSVCEHGTRCVGSKSKKMCKRPIREGKYCRADPFWICAKGLTCLNNTCRKPAIPELGSCLAAGSVCEQGTKCVGSRRKKMCKKPIQEGQKCKGDPFWVCAEGLECKHNICIRSTV